MYGIVMGENHQRSKFCGEFRSREQAVNYMEVVNEILFHYAGFRQPYYVQPTEKTVNGKYYSTER